jgi:hypothetical protein
VQHAVNGSATVARSRGPAVPAKTPRHHHVGGWSNLRTCLRSSVQQSSKALDVRLYCPSRSGCCRPYKLTMTEDLPLIETPPGQYRHYKGMPMNVGTKYSDTR